MTASSLLATLFFLNKYWPGQAGLNKGHGLRTSFCEEFTQLAPKEEAVQKKEMHWQDFLFFLFNINK